MKKIRIFTPCWGLLFTARLQKALARSFAWPKNRAALQDRVAGWHIHTQQSDVSRINDLLAPFGFPLVFKAIGEKNRREEAMLEAARSMLRQCQEEDCLFMTAFPDIVFGEGSLEVMLELAEQKDSCVIVPHIRVTPGFLDVVTDPMSGPAMVKAALAYPHRTFVDANSDDAHSNTFYGGVRWQKIGSNYFVRHSLPNPWLCNLTADDIAWFDKQPQWGTYDHNWPGKILNEQRAVIVGSSDAAFIVEVTEHMANGALLKNINPNDLDEFYRKEPHHKDYRAHVMVFRPE
jgi:hypothetical protein